MTTVAERYEYRLLLWSFIAEEVEFRLNKEAADGWRYIAQTPTGILLERAYKPRPKDGGKR